MGGVEVVTLECASAIVEVNREALTLEATAGGVDVSVLIEVGEGEAVRGEHFVIDEMLFPVWPFEPEDADAVTVGGEEIGLAVAIEVARKNVGGSGFVLGHGDAGPGLVDFFCARIFPVGEPVAVFEGLSFRCDGDFAPAVAVEIAEAEVVAPSCGVSFWRRDVDSSEELL